MRLFARASIAGFGLYDRECPLCGRQGRFLAEVHLPDIFNFDALCPSCGSLPRNRLLWLNLTQRQLIMAQDRVLHFAPEECLTNRIRSLAGSYKTADLVAAGVDLNLNIEKIDLPDGSQDACHAIAAHRRFSSGSARITSPQPVLPAGSKRFVAVVNFPLIGLFGIMRGPETGR